MSNFERQGLPGTDEAYIRFEAYPITARTPVRAALRVMDVKHIDVLPVIEDPSGRAVGIVLRQGLERGCLKMGHNPDECVVAEHTLREVLGAAGARGRVRVSRSVARQYRLVLDGAGYPIAILQYK